MTNLSLLTDKLGQIINFLKIIIFVVITTDFYKTMCYNKQSSEKQFENGGLYREHIYKPACHTM